MSENSEARSDQAAIKTTAIDEPEDKADTAGEGSTDTDGEGREERAAPSPVVGALQEAATGLLFPSETDAPLTPFFWPAEKPESLTPERLRELAQAPADAPIKSVKLETFFRPATKQEDWHNDEEKAQVAKFQELLSTIKNTLKEVKVFRVGETKIGVYIVGHTDGGYVGLKTTVVET